MMTCGICGAEISEGGFSIEDTRTKKRGFLCKNCTRMPRSMVILIYGIEKIKAFLCNLREDDVK